MGPLPKGIVGKKLGMTQIFLDDGNAVAVTAVSVGPCRVVQKKTKEVDGYRAVQLGFGEKKASRVNRPAAGHFKKHGAAPAQVLREFRTEDTDAFDALEPGQLVPADLFKPGEYVDVTGTTKGHGFTGTVKRWNFNRGPMTHGSMYHRRVGSLNATDPQRVFKGRRMPGRMGNERRTIQGLKIVKVDPEKNLLLIEGSVPGKRGSFVLVRETVKHKK